MPGPSRRARLALLAVSSLAGLLILELGYRFHGWGFAAFSIERMNGVQPFGETGMARASDCPGLSHEIRPGLRRSFKLAPFETNADGLRDRAYARAKPPGTFRIAVVGDSLTMGSGVPLEAVYHSRVEARLARERRDRRFELINFGTAGYGLAAYRADLHCRVEGWDPDLVLVGFYPGNDHRVDLHGPAGWRPKPRAYPAFHSFAGQEILHRIDRYLRPKPSTAAEPTPEQRAHVEEQLAGVGAWSRERGVPVVLLYLAYRSGHPIGPAELAALASANGLRFLDLSGGFEGLDPKRLRIYPSDGHPGAEANRIFAEQLHAGLVAMPELSPTRVDDP